MVFKFIDASLNNVVHRIIFRFKFEFKFDYELLSQTLEQNIKRLEWKNTERTTLIKTQKNDK